MSNMSERMNGILSRVLSEEIAHQEIWRDKETDKFGLDPKERDEIITEIKQFMKDNDIKFRYDFYIQQF